MRSLISRIGRRPLGSIQYSTACAFAVDHRWQVLKVDVEGYELNSMHSVWELCAKGALTIDQLNMEVHAASASLARLHSLFSGAARCNLMLHHEETNWYGCHKGNCAEFSWVSSTQAMRAATRVDSALRHRKSDNMQCEWRLELGEGPAVRGRRQAANRSWRCIPQGRAGKSVQGTLQHVEPLVMREASIASASALAAEKDASAASTAAQSTAVWASVAVASVASGGVVSSMSVSSAAKLAAASAAAAASASAAAAAAAAKAAVAAAAAATVAVTKAKAAVAAAAVATLAVTNAEGGYT